ncbi:polymorphic toxin-type HINT domain-containing protein [Aeoliella sp.]|uniref:polymorphic toxin-type HINT domain-containing protein n=1 Tax=Aeoliella sp. TaxID=2795800 RepID=UPI003CCC01CD
MTTKLWMVVGLCVGAASMSVAAESSVNRGLAERMTREALAAGASGDMELREQLLDQVLQVSPNHAPARWARGQMRVDGEWKPIATVQGEASGSREIDQYLGHRQMASQSTGDQYQLAKWCKRNGLKDEARYHWLQVLDADRDNKEALRALDSRWVGNQLLPNDEAEQVLAELRKLRKRNATWRTRITGWRRALRAGGDQAARALADVEAVVDESAITEFENLIFGLEKESSTNRERNRQLCAKFLSALERLPSHEASASLVRIGVLCNDRNLRWEAIQIIKERPDYEVIPDLIAGLSPIIETKVETTRSSTGRISYTHEFFAEGPDADYVTESSVSASIRSRLPAAADVAQFVREAQRAERASYSQWQLIARDASRLENRADRINASRKRLNGRIVSVLQEVTGEDLGNDPTLWWDYWREENGYEKSEETIEYRTYLTYITPPPPSCECFAAGTLVWTKTGTQAIETLTAGDVVLTMDERTGERCFRPVLETTIRQPSPLLRIATEGYQLLATPGHPFWVEGTGWRMAKELEQGDRVLSANGMPIAIRAVVSTDIEEEAFNLVVEGNNNYFVGPDGLLSHDNTPRRPELARAGKR